MRYVDAPRAGWYPDPESRTSLRWWDGFDWSEIRRAPPSNVELIAGEAEHDERDLVAAGQQVATAVTSRMNQRDNQQLVDEVRIAARQEVDRAAQEFSDRATTAVRRVAPLISEYTNRLTKWVRRAAILAIVLLTAYFVFQVVVQASFIDWIGDRIDNVTDESGSSPPSSHTPGAG
jgi:hypothetical protein